MENNTDEKLDVILNLYRQALVRWVEQSEFDDLKNNPAFKNGDEYNSALKYLKSENYINDQGITPKGEKFVGFVETTRLEKELLKERATHLENSNQSIVLTIKNISLTKWTIFISVCALVVAFIALMGQFDIIRKKEDAPIADVKSENIKDSVVKKADTAQRNYYDANHLKQGIWDFVENKKIKGYQTFKNDTLHGPSQQWINYPEQIMTQEFYKGVEHGFRKYYEGKSLNMVVKFRMGQQLWAAFPSVDAQFPKPVKGGQAAIDSVYIECPYANDTIWYRGLYLNHKPAGIHKMYFPNGKPRFEYNYSTLKIKTFDSTGKLISDKKDDGTWLH